MRPASRTSSRPLTSSTPMLSRPIFGRSRSNNTCAIAPPITARLTRWCASAPIEAPRSSTIDSPRSVGHSAAMAGRSMPGMVFKLNFAMAMRAPVLPADTAASASPFFTASSASHIDDFQRPWRSAWLGFSSILTATSVWTTRDTATSARCSRSSGSTTAASPKKMNSLSGWRLSASPAPGTTTAAPRSPPMASSAIRTFFGMDRRRSLGGGSVRCDRLARAAGTIASRRIETMGDFFPRFQPIFR